MTFYRYTIYTKYLSEWIQRKKVLRNIKVPRSMQNLIHAMFQLYGSLNFMLASLAVSRELLTRNSNEPIKPRMAMKMNENESLARLQIRRKLCSSRRILLTKFTYDSQMHEQGNLSSEIQAKTCQEYIVKHRERLKSIPKYLLCPCPA